ncbi:hypothetical protein OE88DRAFT_1672200 [Heliocybe sulcata]|uniref:Oxidase ustYa n=1 Tax=Heliocybe sulcata TaxID=5364 RepID=A0A5C3NDU7_9AGAM|nr:hypothetical protein OE88DRAFT_1672200 [Heliocybe sulcata]
MHYSNALAFLLLVASGVNIAYVASQVRERLSQSKTLREYSYVGHDHPMSLPLPDGDLSLVALITEETVHYPLLGPDSDTEWDALSSAGYGYVRLGPDDRLFSVSMFHELHCLRMLNLAFGKAHIASRAHIKHCLNYLRQNILCSPDLTLEPGDFEEKDFSVEGEGSMHVCRDWSSVYPVMDEDYYRWSHSTVM